MTNQNLDRNHFLSLQFVKQQPAGEFKFKYNICYLNCLLISIKVTTIRFIVIQIHCSDLVILKTHKNYFKS